MVVSAVLDAFLASLRGSFTGLLKIQTVSCKERHVPAHEE